VSQPVSQPKRKPGVASSTAPKRAKRSVTAPKPAKAPKAAKRVDEHEAEADAEQDADGTVASLLPHAAAPPGFALVAACPALDTEEQRQALVGHRVLHGWDDGERLGWFLGRIVRSGVTPGDLRQTPTANFVVRYAGKETGGRLHGLVACELSERTHGVDQWWVLATEDAAPPSSRSAPMPAPVPVSVQAPVHALVPAPVASRAGRKVAAVLRFGDAGEQDGAGRSFRSVPVASKPIMSLADESAVPAYAVVGAQVWAVGLHAGVRKRFRAEVIRLRKQFPRIVVKYVATEAGGTHKLELPDPITAYLTMTDLEPGGLLIPA
jgi:hypothetical protein